MDRAYGQSTRPSHDAVRSAPTERDSRSGLSVSVDGIGTAPIQMLMAAGGNQAVHQLNSPVQMARGKNNVADTGITSEAQAMVSRGEATDITAALELMMKAAKADRDTAKQQRIKKTQKALGARHSRQSKDKK